MPAKNANIDYCGIRNLLCLKGAACGLFRDSTVLLEQVRTLDKSRLGEYMGSVGEDKMWEVDAALHISVGLAETYR